MENNGQWTIEDSLATYQIDRWGEGYFGISKEGDLCVYPTKNPNGPIINIHEVIKELKQEGIGFPVVVRFHDILRSQIQNLNETFLKTIAEADYQGKYMGVYPIKVNQLREVVEEIVDVGEHYNYGLEAGSKAELMAVLAYNQNPEALTILNGYKDHDYIKLAMLGTLIGRKIVIVIEKLSEVHTVLELAEFFKCEPILGVRAKLNSKADGKWSESSGEFAKFGLSASEILDLKHILDSQNKLHWLKLFHFHVGSQIPDIRSIKECILEGARIYANLIEMGVQLDYFDVGGGVGINYDGSSSNNSYSSINYKLEDYIADVVYILKDICDLHKVKHPNIVSETGRAVAAHHSCVITKVFGQVNLTKHKNIETDVTPNDHLLIKNIKICYHDLNEKNYVDIYNDACIIKDEVASAFKLGVLNLTERSIAESLYWNICHRIVELTKDEPFVSKEINDLKTVLSDKYLCNFSLFQSAPDTWAINQILPVVPITRHDERPDNTCTIADITCDSDGKINSFLGPEKKNKTLPVHNLKDQDYYVGLFLTGAYQDVMGDMHNLFGRLNEAHIFCDDDDPTDFYIEEIIHGNTSAEVLNIMQHNPIELCRKVKLSIDQSIKDGKIKPRSGVKLNDFFEACLNSYTYLN